MTKLGAIIGSILLLFFASGCGSTGVSGPGRTMEVTVFVPADPQAYGEMITGEQDFQKAAAMPFVKRQVVVPYSTDLLRASADAAAGEIGLTQAGPLTIVYLKVENGTVYILTNIDSDGWAGVSFSRAYCHPIVEKTLLQFGDIKRVVWDEAPGERKGITPGSQDAKMNENCIGKDGAGAEGQEKTLASSKPCVIPKSQAGRGARRHP